MDTADRVARVIACIGNITYRFGHAGRSQIMNRTNAVRRLCRFLQAREAVSALEYAILVGIITVGVGAAVAAFTGDLQTVIAGIGDTVTDTAGTVADRNINAPNP